MKNNNMDKILNLNLNLNIWSLKNYYQLN